MGIRSKLAISGGIVLSIASFAPFAHAQGTPTNIANVSEVNGGSSPFSYTAGAAGAATFQAAANTAVFFNSNITTPSTPASTNVLANLVDLNAVHGTETATVIAGVGTLYTVSFQSVSGDIYGGAFNQDFLSFNFTSGTSTDATTGVQTVTNITLSYFSSQPTSATFSVSSSETPPATAPGLNDFSSGIYDFSNPNSQGNYFTSENFSINLQPVTPATPAGTPALNSFVADGNIIFSATPGPSALPEPSALIFATLGAGVSFLPILRRKRSK